MCLLVYVVDRLMLKVKAIATVYAPNRYRFNEFVVNEGCSL